MIDLGSLQSIRSVNSYSYGRNAARVLQIFSLYGSTADTTGTAAEFNEADSAWTLIASVNTPYGSGANVYGASSITGINADYRELMWVAVEPTATLEHTTWKEFDVFGVSLTGYDLWASTNGVGASTNDFDNDGLSNLTEYGLNGNPTNALNQGTMPVFSRFGNGFIYVHPKRSDDVLLIYTVETTTNLLDAGSWTNDGYTVTGTNITGGTLDFVTNDVDTIQSEKFIRLKIEQ